MSDNSRPFRLVVNKAASPTPVAGVYLITDQGDNLIGRVRIAFSGGVSSLQYRAKGKPREECLLEGNELKQLCRSFGVSFIVNDDIKIAQDLDADGVHLGQEDGSISAAREILGAGKIIGKSTHNLEEAVKAEQEGADYIGFGAMYPTDSKAVAHIPGTTGLTAIRDKIRIPIVAVGGITTSNACRVIDAGADALAVISSVLSSPRPEIAVAELKLLFNRNRPLPRGSVLAVAGSDSGGGAGIQADIKTITLLGSYAATVLTSLTAQNTRNVTAIHGIPPSFVINQLDTVLQDIPVDVIKTGMLHTPAIIAALAEWLGDRKSIIPLVIDPVMIAKGGAALMERDSIHIFREQILPLAYLLTPNIPEAEKLLGRSIRCVDAMRQAACDLHKLGAANVLIKGGHLTGREASDILYNGSEWHTFNDERLFTSNTHGTGCTFASAIAAFLSQGEPLRGAVEKGKAFITAAIRQARQLGKGHSPVNHFMAAQEIMQQ
ncbi:MAG: bifunctional hydroxymethylpyrimidine kinase/phosphomethylpyrimidine kinase [Deltaproteobacteria bacterium]